MIRRITDIKALPDHQQQVLPLLTSLVESARQQQGCCQYELYQDGASENLFLIEELWCSQENLNQYQKSKQFKQFKESCSSFLEFTRHRIFHFTA